MKTKLVLYWTIIRLVMKYASETLVLKVPMKSKLLTTERNILKRIFRPKMIEMVYAELKQMLN